jgi:Integrase core domain
MIIGPSLTPLNSSRIVQASGGATTTRAGQCRMSVRTARREFLDHVLFWNGCDLERKLADFQAYYNAARSHASLEGHTPLTFAGGHTVTRAELSNVRWVSHCRNLVQLPVAA